jgi:hypothetical protein
MKLTTQFQTHHVQYRLIQGDAFLLLLFNFGIEYSIWGVQKNQKRLQLWNMPTISLCMQAQQGKELFFSKLKLEKIIQILLN